MRTAETSRGGSKGGSLEIGRIVARIATALNKLPSEVRATVTLPQYYEMAEYWREFPPTHEIASLMARVFTAWRPQGEKPAEDDTLPESTLPEFED